MVRLQTASRLHFGLLSLTADGTQWPDRNGTLCLPARRFGGAGLMVEHPGIRVRTEQSKSWSAKGPLAERATAFARRFLQSVTAARADGTPCEIVIEEASAEHAGLGTGTQLGLAVASCLATEWRLPLSASELARHIGRGERSALGVHGFEHGGFLVEGGQGSPGSLSPLIARAAFPADWRIVLARPLGSPGMHGDAERAALSRLSIPLSAVDALCRLVMLGMLPALVERDIRAFGEALFDFNARAGEVFAPFQGGVYASAIIESLVCFIRDRKIAGVGQSSWGPTVFAVLESEDEARNLSAALRSRYAADCEVIVTAAANRGAYFLPNSGPT
jgi:beta-RFAP synthase